jgi:hypothetical protein
VPQLNPGAFVGGLLAATPMILCFAPSIGVLVARSQWTPLAWVCAVAVGFLGEVLFRVGALTANSSVKVLYWAPLFQLAVYSAALFLFLRLTKRLPRNVTFNFATGLFWDRAFAFVVAMASLLPVIYLAAPR